VKKITMAQAETMGRAMRARISRRMAAVKLLAIVRERKKAGGPYDVSTFMHTLWVEGYPNQRSEMMQAFGRAIAPGGCLEIKPESGLSATSQYVYERSKH
jgi:hypothetical protein